MRPPIPVLCLMLPALALAQPATTVNPKVKSIVEEISEERISATLKRLEAFGTRHSLSSTTDPEHGIGAARKWIYEQFRSYSPRLQVSYDTYHVRKHGRIVRDTDIVNVVALLPGAVHPERQLLLTAHYDSLAMIKKPRTPAASNDRAGELPEGEGTSDVDWEKSADAPLAPGVTDDGSGVAAVMELARVMSRNEFENTIVFVAFAGEEEGLIGSTLYAAKAQEQERKIDAVLNNDIIGSDVSGDGRGENRAVNVYSSDPIDSASRGLARYIKTASEKYVPAMKVNLIFRGDRFARGGDHTPFDLAGYAAVRVTTPTENFSHQHNATDTFANTSPAYTTLVAKVNAAALACLAFAPNAPVTTRIVTAGEAKGSVAPRVSRGKSGYDAVIRWAQPEKEPNLAGYAIVMRSTQSPVWQTELFVGDVLQYTIPSVSIDQIVLGVKAVDKEGNESVVAPYVAVPRPLEKIETF